MTIEIVVFPSENGDFPQLCKRLPVGTHTKRELEHHHFIAG